MIWMLLFVVVFQPLGGGLEGRYYRSATTAALYPTEAECEAERVALPPKRIGNVPADVRIITQAWSCFPFHPGDVDAL